MVLKMCIRNRFVLICTLILFEVLMTSSIDWSFVRCAKDTEQTVPEGSVANIGRFPWLGVVQHSFYVGGKAQYAITSAVLVHPMYAIAPAEDMVRILHEQIQNNTVFILWSSARVKYAINVLDYMLHPEHEERGTLATVALLELDTHGETTFGENKDNVELQKEVYKMEYVNDKDCEDFYIQNKLTYPKMTPVASLCTRTEHQVAPCVWDGGVALITMQSWGFWKILGFSVRGPGCGAPARFLVLHDYLQWVDDIISQPDSDEDDEEGLNIIGFRRLSPIKIVMYSGNKMMPKELGDCGRPNRGNVLYKEAFEFTMSKDYGQAFFYVVISQAAEFKCAIIDYQETTYKSNAAIWIENYCHRELTGLAHGIYRPIDYRKQECFIYFKSSAFIKFRFLFSFRTIVEVSIWGRDEVPKEIPNPFFTDESTDNWFPTTSLINWGRFTPISLDFWYM